MRYLLTFTLALLATSCIIINTGRISDVIYVRHKGADMPAHVHGDPAKNTFLIVLHGAGSFGLAFRDGEFSQNLEDDYVVVYFDQRGQSMAQGHYSKPEDLVDLMAEDVLALAAVLREKYGEDINLFLMGHSWGGLLSGATLLKDQSQFAGWINVAGATDIPLATARRGSRIQIIAEEQIDLGNSIEEWTAISEEVDELDPSEESSYRPTLRLAARAIELLLRDEVIESTTTIEKLAQAILANNPITWAVSDFFNQPVSEAREMDYSLTPRLQEITLPTLMIFGRYDVSVPLQVGAVAFEEIGSDKKDVFVFEQTIHHPHDTEGSRFVQEVRRFIEENR
ncbi:MAG: alpha/beta hydrolase [Bacteroidota bacterium]